MRLDLRLEVILANATAFLFLVLLLHQPLEPGKPIDRAAVLFGADVHLVSLGIDCSWFPRRAGTSLAANVASGRKRS
jgi:hypothetical protein